MSKRKLEATKRNQERKAGSGRRTPPGYKKGGRGGSLGGRRIWGAIGAVFVVVVVGVALLAGNVFGSDAQAGMKTLVKNGTCV